MTMIILKTSLLAILISCYADYATATLQRSNSVANLYTRNYKSAIESPEKYIELTEKFFEANKGILNENYVIGRMQNELCSITSLFYSWGRVFGVKEYANIHNDSSSSSSSSSNSLSEVLAIDISWPNLKRVIRDLPQYQAVGDPIEPTVEAINKGEPLTLPNLKWILEKSPLARIGSEESLEDGNNESGLTPENIDLLMKLCVGSPESRVFTIPSTTTYDGKKIDGTLRKMAGNMTGVQRIMSVLAVSIVNSLEDTPC
ncbi:hypothetical protein FACS1894122_15690 [Alphaproteobacteria bacterium]|nr:hypothetical protein FACS1894122_15690 [Alphaproteobacteria bacterium]